MTYVKICGLSKLEHVQCAVKHEADFIGFVFAPSRRQITPANAALLAQQIPTTTKIVGVFVNEQPEIIRAIYEQVSLDYVQYHGDESNEFIQQVGLPSIKAFSVRQQQDVVDALQYDVDFYLFDTPGTDFRGGSGETFDWSLITSFPHQNIILAGGLTPTNVAQAIETVQPFAVDVSSGVEDNGQKSIQLIQQFIEAAKGASIKQ